jgi:hypothetical protein
MEFCDGPMVPGHAHVKEMLDNVVNLLVCSASSDEDPANRHTAKFNKVSVLMSHSLYISSSKSSSQRMRASSRIMEVVS